MHVNVSALIGAVIVIVVMQLSLSDCHAANLKYVKFHKKVQ